MTFEEILDQAVAMLQRQGRVAYRALKRQFDLDDAAFDDLKAAVLYAHPEVLDDEGRGLIWSREGATTPMSVSPAALPAPRSVLPEGPPRPATRPGEFAPADAERRQLTVMFCDLVDSTPLAGRLDPEDYRDVVRAYLETCAGVIQRFDGHIAKYLGDGILVYFGYPRAHEDDAQRAVYAGLGMLEAMAQVNEHLAREHGLHLAVRVGIHTGLVVAGEFGGGATREPLAIVGETPNIAARLQGVADPDTVVLSAATYQLVQGVFACEDLGMPPLKGVATPLRVYRVRGECAAESRFEAVRASGLMPLIGRDEELNLVLRRWAQATAGEGQVVLLTGEPGIGKSRLLEAVRERLITEPHLRLQYQCSPYHTNSAFYPIIVQLARAAHFAPGDSPAQQLDKLEALLAQATTRVAEVAPLLAALLSLPTADHYPPLTLSPQRQKAQTIATLVDQVAGRSRCQPVLCLVEDAHWCDPTTLEVLERLADRVPDLRVLLIITARPEFAVPWMASHTTALTLTRLSRAQVAAMVTQLTAGKALPPEVLAQILTKTDGVPLFVEELTKTILESGLLREIGERYALTGPLPPLAIPATVQDSLMARLDRLAPTKEVAQLGAVLGREFAYEVLAAVSPQREPALSEALAQLIGAGLLFRRGQPVEAHYRFKHALMQEAAYASLLKSTRQQLHRRIATVLEARFPAMAEMEPEVVARHYTEAGLPAQAIPYWQRAAERAMARSAHREAVGSLEQALNALAHLPDTRETREQAVDLQLALSSALRPLGEFGRIAEVLREAESLAAALHDPRRLGQIAVSRHCMA
jgi:class 3 adenylate cyclase